MTRPCMTHQSMSVTLMSICLVVVTIIPTSSSFPLRHVGVEKKVIQYVAENRDLILCWVVQIKTNAKCSCIQEDDSTVAQHDDMLKDVPKDGSNSRLEFQQQSGCRCEPQEIREHISAFSEEVGLQLLHTFGQFHDHVLLCLLDERDNALHKKALPVKSKSETVSWIHRIHSDLKSKDKMLFDKHKEDVEDYLRRHEEVLWFSSEYVHHHHSRSVVPEIMHRETIQHDEVPLSSLHVLIADAAKQKLISSEIDSVHKSNVSVNLNRLSQDIIPASAKDGTNSVIKSLQLDNSLSAYGGMGRDHFYVVQNSTQVLYSQNQHISTDVDDQGFPQRSLHSLSSRSLDLSFNDPKYPKQWHLDNKLTAGMDLNVTGVWRHRFTGQGITVAVVDDGLQWMNPDLKANYNYKGSWDMNDDDPDPTPSASKLSNHHGTRCAGEIAAVANNTVCGVGVAYEAQVSGLRVLDGLMTDSMEAEAFNKKMEINDIYSCSWGPDDDGRTVDGPHLMAAKAMKYGVDFGRRGYGSIFVLASGNGGENKDNCNFDGYANSIYTVTIGAVDDKGGMPYYAEECASMLGVTFSSGTTNKRDIVTTDWTLGGGNGCTENHTGTSAAAPLAAAMIALMLQARPCLTWRDVQYIIILTGQKVDVHLAELQENGAGLSHSHKHGFGLLNSWRLVNAARVWQMVPWLTSYSYAETDLNLEIPKGKDTSLRVDHVVSEKDIQGLSLFILENVQLTLSISHPCRGKIGVTLTSPSGTVSVLATSRPKDNSTDGFNDWTFTSVRCWGEIPTGNWSFNVIDFDDNLYGHGKVTKWRLTLFGTPMTREEFKERQKRVESAMSGEFLDASALPCPPAPKYETDYAPVSDRTLKILILSGAFCLIMAIYETFEYIFCYNDEKKETATNRRLSERAQQLASTPFGLENGGHDFLYLSNGASPCTSNNNVNNVANDDDDDDIFDASETSRLLVSQRNGRSNPGVNAGMSEDIPLSTFSIESGVLNSTSYLPLPTEDVGVDIGDMTANVHTDNNRDADAKTATSEKSFDS